MRLASLATVVLLSIPAAAHAQMPPSAEAASDEQTVKAARLGTTGAALIEFFKGRTQQTAAADQVEALIKQLGEKEPEPRDKAFAALVRMGMVAVPLLRQAANTVDEADAAPRARECLKFIEGDEAAALSAAAARLLAHHNPDGAFEALLGVLPFAESDKVAKDVEEALTSVAAPKGKLHAGLLQADKDEAAICRAVAADVICQVGDVSQRQVIKALLQDPKATVRFRVALGLARRHDAEAVPVLIDLLADLPAEQRGKCEEFLTELAGDWAVNVPGGRSPFERKLRRDVWMAWWKATEGTQLLDEFRARTPSNADRDKVLALMKELGKESAKERDQASAALVAMGTKALPLLRRAAQEGTGPAAEAARRCAEAIEQDGGSPLPSAAARLVALRKPEGAAEALLGYVPFAEGDEMAEVLQEVMPDLVLRDGKVDPAFVKGLADPVPARRIAAADALAQHAAHHDPVRKLLKDADLEVRLRAALALASGGDKDAVPVLIDLLADGPADQVWMAEDYLVRLAGDKKPDASLGGDAEGRKKARDAWAAWWKASADSTRLVRREALKRTLGFTVVVEQYNNFTGLGRVLELDPAGKTRWEVGNLQSPWDAQVIGNDRVLVAEHNLNRVSERDLKGNVKWQKQVVNPVSCERLKNGNTFIARRQQLMEVDKDGREVVSIVRNTDYILSAGRLRDGTFAFVNNNGYTYVRLDRTGKELKTFRVPFEPVGGTLYFTILPNGNVLVGQYSANKVFEVDREGKRVWEAKVTWPNMVTRLPNGNVLVCSMNTGKITELDRSGKVVRELTIPNTRPWVAYRR